MQHLGTVYLLVVMGLYWLNKHVWGRSRVSSSDFPPQTSEFFARQDHPNTNDYKYSLNKTNRNCSNGDSYGMKFLSQVAQTHEFSSIIKFNRFSIVFFLIRGWTVNFSQLILYCVYLFDNSFWIVSMGYSCFICFREIWSRLPANSSHNCGDWFWG